jgi:hypothetical protein
MKNQITAPSKPQKILEQAVFPSMKFCGMASTSLSTYPIHLSRSPDRYKLFFMKYTEYIVLISTLLLGFILYRLWHRFKVKLYNNIRRFRTVRSFESGHESLDNRTEFYFRKDNN